MAQAELKGLARVKQARARLMINQRFFGTATLSMQLEETKVFPRAATNGKRIAFNTAWSDTLSLEEIEAVLCHEVLHCLFFHQTRRDDRDHETWNKAGDYAINLILHKNNMKLPADVLLDQQYDGMPAEVIYQKLMASRTQESGQNRQQKQGGNQGDKGNQSAGNGKGEEQNGGNDGQGRPGNGQQEGEGQEGGQGQGQGQGQDSGSPDGNSGEGADGPGSGQPEAGGSGNGGNSGCTDGGGSDPGSLSRGNGSACGDAAIDQPWNIGQVMDAKDENGDTLSDVARSQHEQDWKIQAQQSLAAARRQGSVPGGIQRLVEEMCVKKIDVEEALRMFMSQAIADDYNWRRPNANYMTRELYMPSLYNDVLPDVVMVMDTSGSVTDEQTAYFQAKVNSVLREFNTVVHVIYCDTEAHYAQEYRPEDLPITLKPIGNGGTDFRPPFKVVADMGIEPACLIYLTDLECSRYPNEPKYPVLWAVYNKYEHGDYQVPFGEAIDVNPEI